MACTIRHSQYIIADPQSCTFAPVKLSRLPWMYELFDVLVQVVALHAQYDLQKTLLCTAVRTWISADPHTYAGNYDD